MIVGWRGIGVTLEGPDDLCAGLASQLPPFYGDPGPSQVTAVLSRTHDLVHLELPDDLSLTSPAPEVFRAGASRVELIVAARLPDRAVVHAGVVAIDGRAVLLPGSSMAGKSTLVAALVEAGATYVSDEFALLDADGQAHPYPRWLTRRGPEGSTRVDPASLGAVARGPAPVALVAALRWTGTWDVEPLSAGRGALSLLEHCVTARRDPSLSLDAVAAACTGAACVTGTRGEAADAVARIRDLL